MCSHSWPGPSQVCSVGSASLPSLPQLSCRSPLEVQQTYWPVCMQDPTLGPLGDATSPPKVSTYTHSATSMVFPVLLLVP